MGSLVDSCFLERDRCSYICSRSQSAAQSKRSVDLIVSDTALLSIGGVIRLRFAGLPCAISRNSPFPVHRRLAGHNLNSTRNFVSKPPKSVRLAPELGEPKMSRGEKSFPNPLQCYFTTALILMMCWEYTLV